MKIFDFIKKEEVQKEIYSVVPSISINEMFMVKKYIPYAQKVGIGLRVLSVNYTDQFDYINGRIHLVYEFLMAYSDLEFETKDDDIDVDGLYDFVKSSGCLSEIENKIGSEWEEVNEILLSLVKMKDREIDVQNPMEEFLSEAIKKTPEELEEMENQANRLMENDNIKDMVKFKNRADK